MVRKYNFGNGQSISDYDIPFAPGTDAYYRFIADAKAKAKGETYQKSADLELYERKMAADKLATPEDQQQQWWKDQHKADASRYGELQSQYIQGQGQWESDITDLARQSDRSSQTPEGYALDPASAGLYKSLDPFFTGHGKMGGAGNRNPGTSADNSWNEADGLDVRTDEQRYYDRNLDNYQEVADENGSYHWQANETGYDHNNKSAKRPVYLDNVAERGTSPEDVDAGKGVIPGSTFNKQDYWDYNGAPDKSYFDNEIANRKNLSKWGRTV